MTHYKGHVNASIIASDWSKCKPLFLTLMSVKVN